MIRVHITPALGANIASGRIRAYLSPDSLSVLDDNNDTKAGTRYHLLDNLYYKSSLPDVEIGVKYLETYRRPTSRK